MAKKKAVSSLELTAFCLVPGAGLEPARLAAGDFESPESTNFTTRAVFVKTQIMAYFRDALHRPFQKNQNFMPTLNVVPRTLMPSLS